MRADSFDLSGVPDVAVLDGRWWVAHVKPSMEKRLAEEVAARKVPYYLPLVQRNERRFGKTVKSLAPFFPGYLFFLETKGERYDVVTTHRTVGLIEVVDQKRFVRQLRSIQVSLDMNPKLMTYHRTPTGARVKVVRGPLAKVHTEGIVESIQENSTKVWLVLRLDILGTSAVVEMNPEDVEPL